MVTPYVCREVTPYAIEIASCKICNEQLHFWYAVFETGQYAGVDAARIERNYI